MVVSNISYFEKLTMSILDVQDGAVVGVSCPSLASSPVMNTCSFSYHDKWMWYDILYP